MSPTTNTVAEEPSPHPQAHFYIITIEAYNEGNNNSYYTRTVEAYANLENANASARQCALFGGSNTFYIPSASQISQGERSTNMTSSDLGSHRLPLSRSRVYKTDKTFDKFGCIRYTAWFYGADGLSRKATANADSNHKVIAHVQRISLTDRLKPITPEIAANRLRYMSTSVKTSLEPTRSLVPPPVLTAIKPSNTAQAAVQSADAAHRRSLRCSSTQLLESYCLLQVIALVLLLVTFGDKQRKTAEHSKSTSTTNSLPALSFRPKSSYSLNPTTTLSSNQSPIARLPAPVAKQASGISSPLINFQDNLGIHSESLASAGKAEELEEDARPNTAHYSPPSLPSEFSYNRPPHETTSQTNSSTNALTFDERRRNTHTVLMESASVFLQDVLCKHETLMNDELSTREKVWKEREDSLSRREFDLSRNEERLKRTRVQLEREAEERESWKGKHEKLIKILEEIPGLLH
ncbi:hypothetical protein BJ508DRAFT_365298 [Ascobolus immersus RN42]|uniref:Uncharacterized protein n=1 Tax=Ascobolus immersus RN42 TaxID=1160509 RepID=A0A3N4HVV6_ASCIM|nr:hypothetical protein BJ508DRAFT_365298 [Ascobolus immersus RN42]